MSEKVYNDTIDFDVKEFLDDPELANAMRDADDRFEIFAELQEARKSKKMTQKQVADAMGTTQSAVSDIENGHSDPQISTVQRYARVVGAKFTFCITNSVDSDTRKITPQYELNKDLKIATSTPSRPISISRINKSFVGIYKKEEELHVA